MISIEFTTKDIFKVEQYSTSRDIIIIHICNNIGAWGAGFVVPLAKKWPETRKSYLSLFNNNNSPKLGDIQFVQVSNRIFVCNMIAQSGVRNYNNPKPIRYDALEECLNKLEKYLNKIASLTGEPDVEIHCPRIGCGLAGGSWEIIEKLLNKTLVDFGIPVYVHDLPKTNYNK